MLPDGTVFNFDRGAEQGEPLGAPKSALPLGDARENVMERVGASGACDEWYIDDGQLICKPAYLETWLWAFDQESAKFGASRGSGTNIKSRVHLVCPEHRILEFHGWATEYVQTTCKVDPANSTAEILGAFIGDTEAVKEAAIRRCAKIADKRNAITRLGSAPTELVLTRRCGDVSNLRYWLRCYGDTVRGEAAQIFDQDLRSSLESTIGGQIPDTSWWQSNISVDKAGLGLRTATDIALPAFIGSRVSGRPMVATMFGHIEEAGMGSAAALLHAYDQRTTQAEADLAQKLPTELRTQIHDIITDGRRDALRRWNFLQSGRARPNSFEDVDIPEGVARQSNSVSLGLVADAGDEDVENPMSRKKAAAIGLQGSLTQMLDASLYAGLRDLFESAGCQFSVDRLADLASTASHSH